MQRAITHCTAVTAHAALATPVHQSTPHHHLTHHRTPPHTVASLQWVPLFLRRVDIRHSHHASALDGERRSAVQCWVVMEPQVLSQPHDDVGGARGRLRRAGLVHSAAGGACWPVGCVGRVWRVGCLSPCGNALHSTSRVKSTWCCWSWVQHHRAGSSRGWGHRQEGGGVARLVLQRVVGVGVLLLLAARAGQALMRRGNGPQQQGGRC